MSKKNSMNHFEACYRAKEIIDNNVLEKADFVKKVLKEADERVFNQEEFFVIEIKDKSFNLISYAVSFSSKEMLEKILPELKAGYLLPAHVLVENAELEKIQFIKNLDNFSFYLRSYYLDDLQVFFKDSKTARAFLEIYEEFLEDSDGLADFFTVLYEKNFRFNIFSSSLSLIFDFIDKIKCKNLQLGANLLSKLAQSSLFSLNVLNAKDSARYLVKTLELLKDGPLNHEFLECLEDDHYLDKIYDLIEVLSYDPPSLKLFRERLNGIAKKKFDSMFRELLQLPTENAVALFKSAFFLDFDIDKDLRAEIFKNLTESLKELTYKIRYSSNVDVYKLSKVINMYLACYAFLNFNTREEIKESLFKEYFYSLDGDAFRDSKREFLLKHCLNMDKSLVKYMTDSELSRKVKKELLRRKKRTL